MIAAPSLAQQAPVPAPSAPAPGAVAPGAAAPKVQTPPGGTLTQAELEQLLGPIALYPDDLLANVLAASVYPDEVAEASRFMSTGGKPEGVDKQSWEPSVKAIAKIPDVVKMMGQYMDWTTALGQAYLTQAKDVMASVQALRRKAQANGALQTTEQQKVVVQQDIIYIQPADPQVIYVPSYSPSVVYVDNSSDVWAAGIIGFGAGIVVGAIWADAVCDWHHGCLGWGHTDVNINRNFNGNVNIGNSVNIGNGNGNWSGNRVGREGGAWVPNRDKPVATTRPSELANYRGTAQRPANMQVPRASSTQALNARQTTLPSAGARPATPAARPTPNIPSQTTARTAAGNRMQAPASAGAVGAGRSPGQGQPSAFSGGADTRASATRGAASRQSAGQSSGRGGVSGGARGGGGGARGGGGGRR